jgi:cyclopropane fatty-acyl-phospholipid synthase-like methyltransferase
MDGFSQAADNNKTPILTVLTEWLVDNAHVLEVGSGTGQHAVHMAKALPAVIWQPTDCSDVLPALSNNVSAYGSPNVLTPLGLDLSLNEWPSGLVDCVYAANVIHIVSPALGENLIRGAAKLLTEGGLLVLYGPYKYRGAFTTPSNADFDQWLKTREPQSGIRDFEWACGLATDAGLTFVEDRSMPANNQMLAFRR